MCGRYSLATSIEKLQQEISCIESASILRVSYNIALPTKPMQ